jgi:ketosteroid isomerase-like protein
MSQENVALVKRALDAFNERDLQALREVNDPEIELDWSRSRGVDAGMYRGIEAVLRVCEGAFDAWEKTVFEPDCFIDARESVVVPNVARSRGRDDIVVLARSTLMFTVRSRKIARICLYQEKREALEAVGLASSLGTKRRSSDWRRR